jgi:hypothetical protein
MCTALRDRRCNFLELKCPKNDLLLLQPKKKVSKYNVCGAMCKQQGVLNRLFLMIRVGFSTPSYVAMREIFSVSNTFLQLVHPIKCKLRCMTSEKPKLNSD